MMTWIEFTIAQFRLSQKVFWKRIGFALTGAVLPLGLGIFLSQEAKQQAPIHGAPADLYIVTGVLGFALFFVVYNLVNAVTARRDALLYKRLRGTALPDSSIFVGEGLSASIVSCGVAVLLIGYAMAMLHSGAPRNIPLLVLGLILGAAMFAMLAIGASGMLPNAELSTWIVTPVMVVLMMCSGIFVPLSSLPGPLAQTAVYLPLSPVVSIIRTGFLGHDFASDPTVDHIAGPVGFGEAFHVCLGPIGIVLAWTALGLWFAKRRFRWDPKRTG
jgi:ABC-2 type transport system permease protein